MKSKFPDSEELGQLLRLRTFEKSSDPFDDLIAKALLTPIEDFFDRPGKKIRNQIVELGYLLAGRGESDEMNETEKKFCHGCEEVLEAIHAGSLVVDDIQDGSKVRRGRPALHLKYGVPIALNVGNWLYFWPFHKIQKMGLDPQRELHLYRLCHDAMLRAHFGQAIDVGIPVDTLNQSRVHSVCMASLELKSGALMALAMTLGATLAGAQPERMAALEKFGHEFGIALQMFDDVGNLKATPDASYDYTKRYEDLLLKRPSWIWAVAAKNFSEKDFKDFINAVDHLPDESFLIPWLELHELVPLAKKQAREFLSNSIQNLELAIDFGRHDGEHEATREETAFAMLEQLGERLASSYE